MIRTDVGFGTSAGYTLEWLAATQYSVALSQSLGQTLVVSQLALTAAPSQKALTSPHTKS